LDANALFSQEAQGIDDFEAGDEAGIVQIPEFASVASARAESAPNCRQIITSTTQDTT